MLDMKSLRNILDHFKEETETMRELDLNNSWSGIAASSIHSTLNCYSDLMEEKQQPNITFIFGHVNAP